MWIKTENSDSVQPLAVEECGDVIIVRRNFVKIEATEERSEYWEYEEWQMARDQYAMYLLSNILGVSE